MKEYSDCKKLLFKDGRCKVAVINSDDKLGIRTSFVGRQRSEFTGLKIQRTYSLST